MMISPIEKLDFIFGKARDEFEMKILISSPIVKTALFSLLLTRNINWKLISPKGGCVLGQEQGKEKNLTFDKVGCLTVTVGFAFLLNTPVSSCQFWLQISLLHCFLAPTISPGKEPHVLRYKLWYTDHPEPKICIPDPKCLPSMFRSLGSPLAF